MDKTFQFIFHGAFSCIKGPVIFLLLVGMVVSLVRHPPGQLSLEQAPPVPTRLPG